MDYSSPKNILPTGSYRVEELETINQTTGGVSLNIPIASLPKNRGGIPGYKLSLHYNALEYTAYESQVVSNTQPACSGSVCDIFALAKTSSSGWQLGALYTLDLVERPQAVGQPSPWVCTPFNSGPATHSYQLFLVEPGGTRHLLRLQLLNGSTYATDNNGDGYYEYDPNGNPSYITGNGSGTCAAQTPIAQNLIYYTADSSYIAVQTKYNGACTQWVECASQAFTVYFKDGSTYVDPGAGNGNRTFNDRNGNGVQFQSVVSSPGAVTALTILDQANRTITVANPSLTQTTVAVAGKAASTIETTINWAQTGPLNFSYYNTNPISSGATFTSLGTVGDLTVSNIQLPTQYCDAATPSCTLQYSFAYNDTVSTGGMGEVSSMTTPLGAKVAYSYAMDGSLLTGAPEPAFQSLVLDSLKQRVLSYLPDYPVTSNCSPQVTGVWCESTTYSVNRISGQTTITAPDGGVTQVYFFPNTQFYPALMGGLTYKIVDPSGTTVQQSWEQNVPLSAPQPNVPLGNYQFSNPFAAAEYTTTAGKSRVTLSTEDENGNVTSKTESVWWDSNANPITTTANGMASATPPSAATAARVTNYSYQFPMPDSQTTPAVNANAYWNSASAYLSAVTAVQVRPSAAGTPTSWKEYSYAAALNPPQPGFPGSLEVQTEFDLDTQKGSAPTCTAPCLTGANAITRSYTYVGAAANIASSTDPNGIVTSYRYYPNAIVNGATAPNVFMTEKDVAVGTGVEQSSTYTYDVYTGAVTLEVPDLTNNVSNSTTIDVFGRPILLAQAQGTSSEIDTAYTYSLQQRFTQMNADVNATGDGMHISFQHFDQRGREWRTRELEAGNSPTDVTSGIKTDTQYYTLAGGNYVDKSNPYRTSADAQMGWTMSVFDLIGRVVSTQVFGTASSPTPSNTGSSGTESTTYDEPSSSPSQSLYTISTDEAGATKWSYADSLGRLLQVEEDPAGKQYITSYTYDVLNDLTSVAQSGQTRTFAYTSLGRLASTAQPETGCSSTPCLTTAYLYDNNGNLLSKTDPGGTVTTRTYDALNRTMEKTCSGGGLTCATTTFCYDGNVSSKSDGQCTAGTIPYSHGRLTDVFTDGLLAGSGFLNFRTIGAFDPLGRIVNFSQTTNGQVFPFTYSYVPAGQSAVYYPSRSNIIKFSTTYDVLSRVTSAINPATLVAYTQSRLYWPHGPLQSDQRANGLNETTTYNSRLQNTGVSLGTTLGGTQTWSITNSFGTTQNNGNLIQQTIQASGMANPINQYFGYDTLNRLLLASENPSSSTKPVCPDAASSWCQVYSYDAFGNRAIPSQSNLSISPLQPVAFNTASNQITGTGWAYDTGSRGTVSRDPMATYAYDADGLITAYCPGSGTCANVAGSSGTLFAYDGEGRRIAKSPSRGTTDVYVYDSGGDLASEYSNAPASVAAGTQFLTGDQLGTTRVVTLQAGTVSERHDYEPFGAELIVNSVSPRYGVTGYGSAVEVPIQFTGKERDAETGLDYFGARYMSSAQGRFTSPDPGGYGAAPIDPQSWNMYSYGLNNPLRYVDPDGMAVNVCLNDENGKQTCTSMSDPQYAAAIAGNNPGVNAPAVGASAGPGGGLAGGGVITCGGAVCGSATYQEESMQETTGDVVALASVPSMIRGGVSLTRGIFQGISNLSRQEAPSLARTGASAVENLKNLSGMARSEARQALKDAGFQDRGVSQGGYEKWYHPDGSRVQIRPDGEVVRTTRVWSADGGQKFPQRIGPDGAATSSHNTGEIVK